MLELILVILCLLVVYHHIGFPIVLRFIKTKKNPTSEFKGVYPKIALIVPAYNEEQTIQDKIINTAFLDYPSDKLELIIACDGCEDNTHQRAQLSMKIKEVENLNVSLMNFPVNRGKVAVLNDVIEKADAEIIALSDSSSLISMDGLKRVAAHFQNPEIGVVGGTYHFAHQDNASEDTYWKYQRKIKQGEAHFGSPMGMHGAFYAFRKSLVQKMPANTINDDFILPMKIIAKGFRSIYDNKIRCIETESTTSEMNWKRRLRISAGNLQQSIQCLDLFSFKQPGIAFCFFSGKFLRAWMGLILAAIVLLSAWLSLDHFEYRIFLCLQVLGLCTAFLPNSGKGKIGKTLNILRYLVIGHFAGLVGSIRYLSGLEKGAWKRAN